ncbi:MAG: hypothetical protein Q9204_002387 [Flavoplaca sp. TL-2023a]
MLLPLRTDDLHPPPLQKVASRQDGSLDLGPSPSPSESIASTLPPITFQEVEVSCRQELIQSGGCPVCSVQEFSQILAAPTVGYEAVLSWLSDDPDSETGTGDLRQFLPGSSGGGGKIANRSGTVEGWAEKRKSLAIGFKAMVPGPSFDETTRRQWQHMPTSRQLPEGQTFSAHSNAVKIRLAPHHFTKPLQLRKDPQRQTVWTDWTEYLSVELRCLEKSIATAESLEPECHHSMRRLLRANQPNENKAASSFSGSHFDKTSTILSGYERCRHGQGVGSSSS